MAIIGGPNPFLVTTDPVTGTRIDRIRLTATLNLACYPVHDGRFLWLTRLTTQTVTPLDLSTLTKGSTVNIGTNPVGIWHDGRFLWKISSTGVVGHIDLETATTIETFSLPADVYVGLTGNTRFLWTRDTTTTSIKQIDRFTGTIVDSFTSPANAADLHFDGRFLWILTGLSTVQGTIKQYDPFTGTELGSFNVTNYGLSDGPTGLCGDGRFLYNTELIQ